MDPTAAELELWPKIMMGFCGKKVEVADQLLLESDRDSGPRGQRVRKLGQTIIDSLIRIVPMSPAPAGEGFDIRTRKASAVRAHPRSRSARRRKTCASWWTCTAASALLDAGARNGSLDLMGAQLAHKFHE